MCERKQKLEEFKKIFKFDEEKESKIVVRNIEITAEYLIDGVLKYIKMSPALFDDMKEEVEDIILANENSKIL